jgi:hypothetical protein
LEHCNMPLYVLGINIELGFLRQLGSLGWKRWWLGSGLVRHQWALFSRTSVTFLSYCWFLRRETGLSNEHCNSCYMSMYPASSIQRYFEPGCSYQ